FALGARGEGLIAELDRAFVSGPGASQLDRQLIAAERAGEGIGPSERVLARGGARRERVAFLRGNGGRDENDGESRQVKAERTYGPDHRELLLSLSMGSRVAAGRRDARSNSRTPPLPRSDRIVTPASAFLRASFERLSGREPRRPNGREPARRDLLGRTDVRSGRFGGPSRTGEVGKARRVSSTSRTAPGGVVRYGRGRDERTTPAPKTRTKRPSEPKIR